MPTQPYLPMHAPRKHVSQEQMLAILAKHAPAPLPEKTLPLFPEPLALKLEWRRGGPWFIETVCGRYTVEKALVRDKPRYTAWQRIKKVILGCRDSADEAKALCKP